MQIALIGATGFIGSQLLKEALARGHHVTALVAHPDKLADHPQAGATLAVEGVDVRDADALAAKLHGHELVISAFSGHADGDVHGYYLRGIRAIIAAAKAAGAARLLVVGGAGSLEVAPGVQLVDTPDFPAQWKASALGAREALQLLRADAELDWTMLSPSALIAPGERSGKFRIGTDQLLVDAAGKSAISLEDYAVAMLDEAEAPAHRRRRFTVGY